MAKLFYLGLFPKDAAFLTRTEDGSYVQIPAPQGVPHSLEVPVYRLSGEDLHAIFHSMREAYPDAYKFLIHRAEQGQYGFAVVLTKKPLTLKYDRDLGI